MSQMTKEEFFKLHEETTAHCLEIIKKKNRDYTVDGYVFDNAKMSTVIGVNPILGILLRTMDKIKRIQTFATKGGLAVEGEGVLDATSDIINYMIFIKGLIIEEQNQMAKKAEAEHG